MGLASIPPLLASAFIQLSSKAVKRIAWKQRYWNQNLEIIVGLRVIGRYME
jgi:hypothetical protein